MFLFTPGFRRFPICFCFQKISDDVYILSVCEKVKGLIQKQIIFMKSAEIELSSDES